MTIRRLYLFITTAVCITFSSTTTAYSMAYVRGSGGSTAVTGVITDKYTGKPVDGAVVTIYKEFRIFKTPATRVKTDVYGEYTLRGSFCGKHNLEVSKSGYASASGTVSIANGKASTKNFELTPDTLPLSAVRSDGPIIPAVTQSESESVTLTIPPSSSAPETVPPPKSVSTNPNFRITALSPGNRTTFQEKDVIRFSSGTNATSDRIAYKYTIDGIKVRDWSSGSSLTVDEALKPGKHDVMVEAKNEDGDVASATAEFFVYRDFPLPD